MQTVTWCLLFWTCDFFVQNGLILAKRTGFGKDARSKSAILHWRRNAVLPTWLCLWVDGAQDSDLSCVSTYLANHDVSKTQPNAALRHCKLMSPALTRCLQGQKQEYLAMKTNVVKGSTRSDFIDFAKRALLKAEIVNPLLDQETQLTKYALHKYSVTAVQYSLASDYSKSMLLTNMCEVLRDMQHSGGKSAKAVVRLLKRTDVKNACILARQRLIVLGFPSDALAVEKSPTRSGAAGRQSREEPSRASGRSGLGLIAWSLWCIACTLLV
eukprot:TRINITY_DN57304_c0_g1_i1.p1 TRINITY_DN57304_c0_g1~~TRINITY_DN57304_c0_g1_i1.p1  ORF type:complete len:270 (-),score=22.55 TRINITY_DN57304_c0_g1_i1:27-836(-)